LERAIKNTDQKKIYKIDFYGSIWKKK